MKTNILIAGSGCSGLYCALKLPRDKKITIITKSDLTSNDSYLAQGGMCMLKETADYDSFFEDTMKAGHYENDKKSVEIMIKTSPEIVKDLVSYGARFERNEDGSLAYTKEGAHSTNRIIFHEDVTGKEITSTLLREVQKLSNVELLEYTTLVDILEKDNRCYGAVIRRPDGSLDTVTADHTVLASGGVGGLYKHSTNFRHLTGDALAIASRHNIELQNPDYVQIHPTTFYTKHPEDRSFLISESVRGEGAKLYDKNMNRFVKRTGCPVIFFPKRSTSKWQKTAQILSGRTFAPSRLKLSATIFQTLLNTVKKWDMMFSKSVFRLFRHSTISWAA